MTNQFTFTVTRPTDRLHKPFHSTWIVAEYESDARQILARTYKPEWGYILTLQYDLLAIRAAKNVQIGVDLSLNSASL